MPGKDLGSKKSDTSDRTFLFVGLGIEGLVWVDKNKALIPNDADFVRLCSGLNIKLSKTCHDGLLLHCPIFITGFRQCFHENPIE